MEWKGKEYNDNCWKLNFEGTYSNGEKNGIYKTYYSLGKIKSETWKKKWEL